jgi:phosphatidylinositol alpha-mannosyltransferase
VRIAITHPYSWPEVRRGAERIVVETARALSARGHDVTVLTAGTTPGHSTDVGFAIVRLRRRFESAPRHERWFGRAVLRHLARGRFDIVHSLMPHDAVAAIRTRRLGGHRTVFEEMGIPIKPWWNGAPDEKARLRVVRDVDVYGCMSQFALEVLRRECGRDGVLIPGGVRIDEFHPPATRSARPTVLFSAVLDEPRKGLGALLDAIAIVARDIPDISLLLSGPGDPTPVLAAAPDAARARTVVLPLGTPEDQANRYGTAWVTALPSINESFGMVLIESLACGTPIVVADHSAPPELVTAETGALCEPGDAESIARALRHGLMLAADGETVARCRATAERYDWDAALAPRLEAIYEGG